MDGAAVAHASHIPCVTTTWDGVTRTLDNVRNGLQGLDLAAITVFATPDADLEALSAGLRVAMPNTLVVGCTTAGEIGEGGYIDGSVVAVGLPREDFCVEPVIVEELSRLDTTKLSQDVLRARNETGSVQPDFDNEFAMLLVDGLSLKEDQLVNALVPALGPVPMFGGSAGDALKFNQTLSDDHHGDLAGRDSGLDHPVADSWSELRHRLPWRHVDPD